MALMQIRRAAVALFVAGTLAACGGAPSAPETLSLERSKTAFDQVGIDETRDDVTALVSTATRVGARLAAGDPRAASTAVSPWSVLSLLGMLRAGAQGETAAQLDGAGPWQRLVHIIIPSILPVISVLVIMGVVYTLLIVDLVLVLTGGGPANSTLAVLRIRSA